MWLDVLSEQAGHHGGGTRLPEMEQFAICGVRGPLVKQKCTSAPLYYRYHLFVVKNEVDKACSMYGGEERCLQGFGGET
jgi:hypothetical protein